LEAFEIRKISYKREMKYGRGTVQTYERGTAGIKNIAIKRQAMVAEIKPEKISSVNDIYHREIAQLLGDEILKRVIGKKDERIFQSLTTIHSFPKPLISIPVKEVEKVPSNAFL
jgi:hypothetical protein